MVEVLLESCGQDVAVPENGCNLNENTIVCSPRQERDCHFTTDESNLTPIQNFYNGQSVFVTGGTGFMGKLLIEKLLRECPGISFIYLLVRPKKGKDVHQRIEEIFDDPLFSKLKEKQPKFRHQTVAIAGDCSLPGLGISATDRAMITRDVSIVFHVAATVRFDEKMKLAVPINVRSPKDVIDLCKEMSGLKSFVHVSTAYANCPYTLIEEKVYDPPMEPDKLVTLMECIDEKLLEEITPRLLGAWPNTYTFTKAVAENIVNKRADDLPVGIFRPAIVISTYREPLRGWIDNLYGPTGVVAGAGTGILRSIHCDGSIQANVVPGDLTVNALIACAWDVANRHRSATTKEEKSKDIPVYNYVSKDNPITYDQLKNMSEKYGFEFPTGKAIWYYSFRNTKYRIIHFFYVYLLHLLPALLIDTAMLCLGKQPRMLKIYKKIHKFMDVLNYFTTKTWKFSNDNFKAVLNKMSPEDRENFACDIARIDWDHYFRTYVRGVRVYLIKDPLDTLPQARVRWQRLYWIHQALKLILAYGMLRICWLTMFHLFRLCTWQSA
ncbi:PREDICTED: putative fatty acyl-CoA reductase CG5065 [Dufourea novaeangliae]|uniref:putative fatty acyl-CoA reductase CG5065 n=1 Tax=Dufourea novaeangliae TaxID=178035 RepID=UPI000767DD96|nr:PREDICTED: putative fatty acyl-CoA reductase CG5065 [Dufourea novaeangliae]XP_015435286.1 PREDICTED: putative fatty acyl-CoA reductase CG5065 [Dufourea novaeangliae]XP_015435288.1 PREDICTED: putative fatty acyl-CoA reductase CG5065 [Dufourea novaeangliae]XP_015435289.1 PREDICTED: putative fatty acyl-CoA reductase CG5065 [Dufourea novaeangliae]XP_015435290.1 PREDICTED: putative fatty acyl-CoA reductase CG5065 [Dufourea novaeangliae]